VAEGLSKTDIQILESHKKTMTALAAYLGDSFEFVLHDLIDLDHSIVKIINGKLSGRKEGAPITDLALELLEKVNHKAEDQSASISAKPYFTYFSKSKYGKPVKSVTMGIFGEKKRIIGLLCINMYLDQPIASLLNGFFSDNQMQFLNEHFINDSDELVVRALEKVKKEVMNNKTIPVSLKNKEIITLLYHQGIFKLKNAIMVISKDLAISKNTVYLHLRSLEAQA
jgi:predicted transcriptional regulator YheO